MEGGCSWKTWGQSSPSRWMLQSVFCKCREEEVQEGGTVNKSDTPKDCKTTGKGGCARLSNGPERYSDPNP